MNIPVKNILNIEKDKSAVCLTLTGSTVKEMIRLLDLNKNYIQLAELRLDLLDGSERENAFEIIEYGIPLILTVRKISDGGRWGANPGENDCERDKLIYKYLEYGKSGIKFVDLEYGCSMQESEKYIKNKLSDSLKIIRSFHSFRGGLLETDFSKIRNMIKDISRNGEIPKIALMCTGSSDLQLLCSLSETVADVKEKILLGMGEYGVPSRILSAKFGSLWTYASDGADAPAPGQLSAGELVKLYRFNKLSASDPVFCVTGNPVAHSKSPEIHNNWLGKYGLKGTYIKIPSDNFDDFLNTAECLGIKGISVTVPHKEKALTSSGDSDTLSKQIGAANTLVEKPELNIIPDGSRRGRNRREKRKWYAYNTDAAGFLADFAAGLVQKPVFHPGNVSVSTKTVSTKTMETGFSSVLPESENTVNLLESAASLLKDYRGAKALIIGAGGAARAAASALAYAGIKLIILNRTKEKAKILAESFGGEWGPLSPESLPLIEKGINFVVQTTTVGMISHAGDTSAEYTDGSQRQQHLTVSDDPVPWWIPPENLYAYDMVYVPEETAFLHKVKAAGGKTRNGKGMLLSQAVLQFKLFTGIMPES